MKTNAQSSNECSEDLVNLIEIDFQDRTRIELKRATIDVVTLSEERESSELYS